MSSPSTAKPRSDARRRPPAFVAGLVAIALVLTACGGSAPSPAGTVAASQPPPSASPTSASSSGSPSPQAGLLLAEVRFAPIAGDATFVEIANANSAGIDANGVRLRIGGRDFAIATASLTVGPGSPVVVSFDTPGSTDHPGIPAPTGFALTTDPTEIELLDPSGQRLDRVAWGTGAADPVLLPTGSPIPATLEPGTTIGRPPGKTVPNRSDNWAVFSPGLASPGRENPAP
jgi:hypothetical protein